MLRIFIESGGVPTASKSLTIAQHDINWPILNVLVAISLAGTVDSSFIHQYHNILFIHNLMCMPLVTIILSLHSLIRTLLSISFFCLFMSIIVVISAFLCYRCSFIVNILLHHLRVSTFANLIMLLSILALFSYLIINMLPIDSLCSLTAGCVEPGTHAVFVSPRAGIFLLSCRSFGIMVGL